MLLLLADFGFGLDFFGKVFMCRDPAAARHGLIYNFYCSSIGRPDVLISQFTLGNLREQLRAILIRISTKGSRLFAMSKKIKKRQPRLNDLGGDAIKFDITGVTKHYPRLVIKHDQSLGHIIQGYIETKTLFA